MAFVLAIHINTTIRFRYCDGFVANNCSIYSGVGTNVLNVYIDHLGEIRMRQWLIASSVPSHFHLWHIIDIKTKTYHLRIHLLSFTKMLLYLSLRCCRNLVLQFVVLNCSDIHELQNSHITLIVSPTMSFWYRGDMLLFCIYTSFNMKYYIWVLPSVYCPIHLRA